MANSAKGIPYRWRKSALTRATADRILDDPLLNQFCCKAMTEALAIGHEIGCPIDQTPEERNAQTQTLGAFKTSMLQDVEAGNPCSGIVSLAT
nr:ketopantoate reductase C-terminal domain-containing protein [uncultured Amphritea sp.]